MSKKHKHNDNDVARHGRPSIIIPKDRIFYWAYGSNLSVRQMRKRCPQATKFGPMEVKEAALVFRYYADVTIAENKSVPGGLWQITTDCERALDVYEGVASKNYLKRYFRITIEKKQYTCLFYQMRTSKGVMPPSEGYVDTIAEGYQDFGLDLGVLEAYLQDAWDAKHVTDFLAQKHERRGSPRLARTLIPLNPEEERAPSKKLLLPPPEWR